MTNRLLMTAVATLLGFTPTFGQAIKLERKYTPGEKVLVVANEKLAQSIDMQFMQAETKLSGTKTTLIETSKPNAQGEFTRTHSLKAMSTNVSLPGGMKLAFDSKKPDAAVVPNVPGAPGAGEQMLNSVKESMKAVRVFTFDKANKLVGAKLTGLDLSSMPPAAAAELGEQALIKTRKNQLAALPAKAVKPGDTWKRKSVTSLGAGQNLHQDITYTYRGLQKRGGKMFDKIEAKTTAAELKVAEGVQAQLKGSNVKPSEKSVGEIWFDREAGRIVASKVVIELEGTITIASPVGDAEAGFKIRIDNTTEVKPASNSKVTR